MLCIGPVLGFYWDIENCCVPNGKSAFDIVQKLRATFGSWGSEVEFVCVCDVVKENAKVISDLNLAQVHIIHVNSHSKNAADDKLKCLLRHYGSTYQQPGTVVLISSDVNFAADLLHLKNRLGFVTVIIHNDHASPGLLVCSTYHISFPTFAEDLPDRYPVKKIKYSQQHQVDPCTALKISGIPARANWNKVRRRLEYLSSNCGGRYKSMHHEDGHFRYAIFTFATYDAAIRAQKRLQNEDVFGSKISVKFLSEPNELIESVDAFLESESKALPEESEGLAVEPILHSAFHSADHSSGVQYHSNLVDVTSHSSSTPATGDTVGSSRSSSLNSRCNSPNFSRLRTSAGKDDDAVDQSQNVHRSLQDIIAEYLRDSASFENSVDFLSSSVHQPSKSATTAPSAAFDDTMATGSSDHDRMSAKLKSLLHVADNNGYKSFSKRSPTANGYPETGSNRIRPECALSSPSERPPMVPQRKQQHGTPATVSDQRFAPTTPVAGVLNKTDSNRTTPVCGPRGTPPPPSVPWLQPYNRQKLEFEEGATEKGGPNDQRCVCRSTRTRTGETLNFPMRTDLGRLELGNDAETGEAQELIDQSIQLPVTIDADCGVLENMPPSFGPIDIQVLNLDRNLHIRDIKRLLFYAFAEVSRVIHVTILPHAYGPMIGLVQVPTVRDASNAIARLNRRKIGAKRILLVPIAPRNRVPSQSVRDSVINVLNSVPTKSLPLFRFFDVYETRYGQKICLNDLYEVRDCISLEDTVEGRIVQLKPEFVIPLVACQGQEQAKAKPYLNPLGDSYKLGERSVSLDPHASRVDVSHCHPDPHPLVQHKCMPLSSSHATTCSTSASSTLRSGKLTCSTTKVIVSLKELQTKVHQILKSLGSMALNAFMSTYEAEFGKLSLPRRGEIGVPLEHLINCIPEVEISVSRLTGMKIVQWADGRDESSKNQVPADLAPLSHELVELIRSFPGCLISVNDLPEAFCERYKRHLSVEPFGFSRLTHMLDALGSVIEVLGSGDAKLITLTHRYQKKHFIGDLQSFFNVHLQQSVRNYEVNLGEMVAFWERYLHKSLIPANYGVCYAEDLLLALPNNLFRITGFGDTALITYVHSRVAQALPRAAYQRRQLETFAYEVVKMLRSTTEKSIPLGKISAAYYQMFNKPLHVGDYGFNSVTDLVDSFPDIIQVVDGPPNSEQRFVTLTDGELFRILSEQVTALLGEQPMQELKLCDFMQSFARFTGCQLRLSDYDCSDVEELIAKLGSVIKIENRTTGPVVKMSLNRQVHVVTEQILYLFLKCPDSAFLLKDFEFHFKAAFRCLMPDLAMLRTELADVVQIKEEATPSGEIVTTVSLQPIQAFALKVRMMLEKSTPPLIPVNELEDAWADFFREPLKSKMYGFGSIMGLVRAVSHVLYTKGRGFTVAVCANKNFLSAIGQGHLSESISPPPRNLTPFSPLKMPMRQVALLNKPDDHGMNYSTQFPPLSASSAAAVDRRTPVAGNRMYHGGEQWNSNGGWKTLHPQEEVGGFVGVRERFAHPNITPPRFARRIENANHDESLASGFIPHALERRQARVDGNPNVVESRSYYNSTLKEQSPAARKNDLKSEELKKLIGVGIDHNSKTMPVKEPPRHVSSTSHNIVASVKPESTALKSITPPSIPTDPDHKNRQDLGKYLVTSEKEPSFACRKLRENDDVCLIGPRRDVASLKLDSVGGVKSISVNQPPGHLVSIAADKSMDMSFNTSFETSSVCGSISGRPRKSRLAAKLFATSEE